MRVGIGYDVHPLVQGTKLILGGSDIPYPRGLKGHSDGDALLHSIGDALLGAASLGDLGTFFPDDDPRYEGISSLTLLARIRRKIVQQGFKISNVDTVIVAEEPKLSSYVPQMKENIARALTIEKERVGVKATTSEKLGFLGRGDGIACWSVVSLRKNHK